MARTPDVLVDPTPLAGPSIDVRIRVAWLLRMSRAAGSGAAGSGAAPTSVTEMAGLLRAEGIAATPPSVSGWETGRVAPGPAVVEAYERALGREPGCLRGPIDMTRRTFGLDHRRALPGPPDLGAVDRALESVLGATPGTGAEWLHFCDLALAVQPGLPSRVMRPALDRLVSQMSRSVFTAYVTRYEGLALLRCGQYADLVLESVRAYADEPGVQVLVDALCVVSERGDRPALAMLVGLLEDPDPERLRATVVGLANFAEVHGFSPSQGRHLIEPLLAAFGRWTDDEERWSQLRTLWPLLPQDLRDQAAPALPRPVPLLERPAPQRADRLRVEAELCTQIADRVCAAVGISRQPMLVRLLQEAAFDHRPARSFTSALLLMALPMRGELCAELAAVAHHESDPPVREALASLLVSLGDARAVPHAHRWLHSDDQALVVPGLTALAHVGEPIVEARLAALLDRPGPVGRRALYYAGMTGHGSVSRLAGDVDHPLHVPALWWRRHGVLVTG